MKGLLRGKILQTAEVAAQESTDAHYHGKRTRLFVNGVSVQTATVRVLTDVVLNGTTLDKTFQDVTYVSGVTITTDRGVVDILLPLDNDINE